MANELPEVQPGQRITAEAWNALVRRLNALGMGGGVAVPSFFGLNLAQARSSLKAAGSLLTLGNILDVFGKSVVDTDPTAQSLLVLSQTPPADAYVTNGTSINLVIAAKAAAGDPGASTAPTISGFEKQPVPIKGELHILGTNFASGSLLVTIGGVPVAPGSNSSAQGIFVIVPENLPNPPKVGDPAIDYTVVVTTAAGKASSTVKIGPPLAGVVPTITGTTGSQLGKPMTIKGTGFGADTTKIKVIFSDNIPVVPTTAVDTSLGVVIPASIPGFAAPGDTNFVNIQVQVGDVKSAALSVMLVK